MGLPIAGCWVQDRRDGRLAQVIRQIADDQLEVRYDTVGSPSVLHQRDWRCGLQPGFVVQDSPLSSARSTLGMATVLAVRELAGRELARVQRLDVLGVAPAFAPPSHGEGPWHVGLTANASVSSPRFGQS